MTTCPDVPFRSGFVTLIGRPNAGKSTLLNALMGKKLAITSDTAQTTRHRFRAILNNENSQIVLVDTPGIHKPHDVLGEELNASAIEALDDIDVVALLIDASKPVGRGDEWVAQTIKGKRYKKILVLSKSDLVDPFTLDEQRKAACELADFDEVVCLSAKKNRGLGDFIDAVSSMLPEGPRWFPEDMDTDQPMEVMVAEFIREKILYRTRDEIPHSIGVICDTLEYDKKKDLYRIFATIYVEREGQKGIIIGAKGAGIKAIGSQAREDLEVLLGGRVYLDLQVKVRKNWRRDLNQIRRFGYGEGV